MFSVVQRLVQKHRPEDEPSPMAPSSSGAQGFDALFGCEYMGNSRFEFGAVGRAYETMHRLSLSVRPVQITRLGETRTVFFVASDNPDVFDPFLEEFRTWFDQLYIRSEEPTYFEEYFSNKRSGKTVAWWSLNDNVAWTLDEEVAKKLWCAFTGAPYSE